jgi:hypothetical protein
MRRDSAGVEMAGLAGQAGAPQVSGGSRVQTWLDAGRQEEEAFAPGEAGDTQEKTPYTQTPKPSTLHPKPYTLHPTPYTLHPEA